MLYDCKIYSKSSRSKAQKRIKGNKKKTPKNKNTIGLALAAGGTPAAVATGGIMRGFQKMRSDDGAPSLINLLILPL